MNKLYNTENDIVKGLIDFFNKIDFNFSKPQLKNYSSYNFFYH